MIRHIIGHSVMEVCDKRDNQLHPPYVLRYTSLPRAKNSLEVSQCI